MKYYSRTAIKKKNADYNVIFGERSFGKTYQAKEEILEHLLNNEQAAYVRRYEEDFKGNNGRSFFSDCVRDGLISKYTNGEWNDVVYFSKAWYLAKWDDELQKNILAPFPFCYAFALSSQEHYKSTSYPNITTIVFDEFISNKGYLYDEFVTWMNLLSTIVRDRDNVTIWMLGNSINKYNCPYFKEMGLTHISTQLQGTIEIYTYGDGDKQLKVAVEFTGNKNSKDSDKYFAFDNPKLKMITDGSWQMDIYPHLRQPINKDDIEFSYFIKYENIILQADIVINETSTFTYIHRKTTPIKYDDDDIIYSLEYNEKPNYKRQLLKPHTNLERIISNYFIKEKVFYQSNDIGEIVRSYIENSYSII